MGQYPVIFGIKFAADGSITKQINPIMKRTLFKSMLLGVIAFAASSVASAQVYVKVRPIAPVVVQAPRPGPTHVWIGEEWREDHGGYKYAGGHWEVPAHPGDRWISGHWAHEGRGDRWIAGHWGR